MGKEPKHLCPNSPDINSPEHRERIRQKMLKDLQQHIDSMRMPYAELARIGTQLDLCLTPCVEFNGQTCTLRGGKCEKWLGWKNFLKMNAGPCKYFGIDPTRSE